MQGGFPDEAAGRAYYVIFHAASALPADLGLAFSSHGGLIGAFGKEFAKTGKLPTELHRFLIDAEDDRRRCDYDASVNIDREMAETHVARAKQFLEAAECF